MGFLIALMAQAIASYLTLVITASSLCLLVGLCLLFITFAEDLASDLHALSVTAIPNTSRDQLMKDFHSVMLFFSQVKELSVTILAKIFEIDKSYDDI